MFRRQSAGTQSNHSVRNTLGGLLLILLIVALSPDLGASHANNQMRLPGSHAAMAPSEEDSLNPSGNESLHKSKDITWVVLVHRGYNPSWQCWVLRLDRKEGPQQETSSDFCTKDKADYDNHPDGSSYVTHGGWLDNLTPPDQSSDSA